MDREKLVFSITKAEEGEIDSGSNLANLLSLILFKSQTMVKGRKRRVRGFVGI